MTKQINDYTSSKNKIYYFIKYKGTISAFLAIFTIVFGTYGYYDINTNYLWYQELINSILRAIALFGFNFPSLEEQNNITIISSISALLTIALTAILFFFRDQINKKLFDNISSNKHIGIFGLGQISRTFLDDKSLNNIIIIEKDNTYAEEYRERGFGIQIANAFNSEFLKNNINFDTMEYALISFGDDKLNIEFTKQIITTYNQNKINSPIKLIVHINDKNLSTLFNKSFILKNTNDTSQINIKTFSYFEECARDLFDKYSLDGDTMHYIKSNETLETVLLGDGELIKRVVHKIIALSHFPNQNTHRIYIVHKNASDLLDEIKTYIHYGMDNNKNKFPSIELICLNLDYNKQDFYTHNLWQNPNIENIIICYEDESINIKLGTMLHDSVYLSKTIDNKKVPKIIMGIYTELELSSGINDSNYEYKNMFTFGSKKDIINQNNLINETIDNIAKLIHLGYGDEYNPDFTISDTLQLNKKWFNSTKINDKLSNISQARHIDIKLKTLGLKKVKVKYSNTKELLNANRDILNSAFKNTTTLIKRPENISDDKLKEYSKEISKLYSGKQFKVNYFPESFETNLFDKLLNMEHNRWNTHHYLEGWKYSPNKSKEKKEHDCLISLEEFDNDNIKITAIYDMYSFLYLPNYLAQTQYKIVPFERKFSIGVSGHRTLDNKSDIEKIVVDEISKLSHLGINKIISPLANGSDRIVANIAIKKFGTKLEVPIPFKLEEYKKDFDKHSKEEFNSIIGAIKPIELSDYVDKNTTIPVYNKQRNELYKKCGEYVADNCDILIVIWDDKEAKGTGGTGDIIKYAKNKNKYIIHIHSDTLELKYINTKG